MLACSRRVAELARRGLRYLASTTKKNNLSCVTRNKTCGFNMWWCDCDWQIFPEHRRRSETTTPVQVRSSVWSLKSRCKSFGTKKFDDETSSALVIVLSVNCWSDEPYSPIPWKLSSVTFLLCENLKCDVFYWNNAKYFCTVMYSKSRNKWLYVCIKAERCFISVLYYVSVHCSEISWFLVMKIFNVF